MRRPRQRSFSSPASSLSNTPGRGIRENSILPGIMNTPMVHAVAVIAAYGGSAEEMVRRRDEQCRIGRMADAWDVATRLSVSRVRRGQVHHRYQASRRWRAHGQLRLSGLHSGRSHHCHQSPAVCKDQTTQRMRAVQVNVDPLSASIELDPISHQVPIDRPVGGGVLVWRRE
jgi:hypothetical protein